MQFISTIRPLEQQIHDLGRQTEGNRPPSQQTRASAAPARPNLWKVVNSRLGRALVLHEFTGDRSLSLCFNSSRDLRRNPLRHLLP
jgi:hypothetical protein